MCEPTDRLTVPVVHSAGTWDCSAPPLRDAAQPTSPSPGSPGEEGGAMGVAARAARTCPLPLYLRLSLGRCRGCSSRARPACAAAWRPTSVGPRVRGGSSGGLAAPTRLRLPSTQAAREARAALSAPPTSPWLAQSHCVHSTPRRLADASHACARLWLSHPKDLQEHGCAHWALDEASPFVVDITVACPSLQEYFRKKCLFP